MVRKMAAAANMIMSGIGNVGTAAVLFVVEELGAGTDVGDGKGAVVGAIGATVLFVSGTGD
ncbi:MAG: hypothetical protein RR597_06945 [Christensenella sp.]